MNPGEVLSISAVGMGVVFCVLALLMLVIVVTSALLHGKKKKSAAAPEKQQAAVQAKPEASPAAKGSCGDIMLNDVPEATAAMLMAIVADKENAPLNTLKFISVKEIK